MYHLIYMSSAPEKFSTESLSDLLYRARENNAARNITGMLLHADGNFLQYIEGDRDRVEGLFALISRDRRHRNILRISDGDIDERLFPGWSMGCHELVAAELVDHDLFDLTEANLETHLKPDMPKVLLAMMRQFSQMADRFAPA